MPTLNSEAFTRAAHAAERPPCRSKNVVAKSVLFDNLSLVPASARLMNERAARRQRVNY
jgi:hypothetical protein